MDHLIGISKMVKIHSDQATRDSVSETQVERNGFVRRKKKRGRMKKKKLFWVFFTLGFLL